jgi:DNA transposition AAA+ family ATPase
MRRKLVAITSILKTLELHEFVQEGDTRFICVYGDTGSGKTSLGKYFQSQSLTPALAYIAKANFSCAAFIRDLLGLIELKARGYQDGYNKLIAQYPRERILIVDEAEYLGDENLEVLRKLHDEIGITIVLLGKKDLYTQLKASKHEQLFDRSYHLVIKPLSARDSKDLAATLIEVKLSDAMIEEIRLDVGGNIRRFVNALRCIEKSCKQNKKDSCSLEEWGDGPFFHDFTALPNFNYAVPKAMKKRVAA